MSAGEAWAHPASDLIGGEWVALPRTGLRSVNPARASEVVWEGGSALEHVDRAVEAAGRAQGEWAAFPRERRFAALRRYRDLCRGRVDAIARLIARETGKVLWDAKGEAEALAAKVDITLDESEHAGLRRVSGFEIPITATRVGRTWFRPHGVMAVIAPYNFPAHLANGHIVPALAMGNTVVLKPSDKTPGVGQLLAELFDEALRGEGAPAGVMNLVQGAGDVASTLAAHEGVDGILFTGSWPVGRRILEMSLDDPGRIIALEMGGSNAALVMPDCDMRQALVECVRSSFVTTGQRCTCTRRIVLHRAIADRFLRAFCDAARALRVGDPFAEPAFFMGPIISEGARRGVLEAQRVLAAQGAEVLVESGANPGEGFYLSPGVLRVDRFTPSDSGGAGCDTEVFGPLVRVCVVDSFDEGVEQANATRFGLAASIFTREARAAEEFLRRARAGCVNVNAGTAGASSKLPFGGLGLSGNHRPAGAFSLDYCACPVAGMIERGDGASLPPGMVIDPGWVG